LTDAPQTQNGNVPTARTNSSSSSELTEWSLQVPTRNGLQKRLGGYSDVDSYVALLTDRNGKAVISSTDPQGTVAISNGNLDASAAQESVIFAANHKSSTHALASDLDVNLVEGSDVGEFLAIASKGSVDRVYGGGGDDRMVISSGPSSAAGIPKIADVDGGSGNDEIIVRGKIVDRVSGGEGDDRIYVIESGSASRIESGAGNDIIHLSNTNAASQIDSGAGDDTIYATHNNAVSDVSTGDGNDAINILKTRTARNISAGDGDDEINIHETRTVRNISAGDGNDVINISAEEIEGISGGRGDDRFLIENFNRSVSSFYFSEGDGQDLIKANRPVKLQRFSEDGTQTLDLSKAVVTYENNNKVKISFADSSDSIIVDLGLGRSRIVVEATDDGGLVITRPDYAEMPPPQKPHTVGVSASDSYIFL
jgi:Ca2+-binding RTX toxin-like protein